MHSYIQQHCLTRIAAFHDPHDCQANALLECGSSYIHGHSIRFQSCIYGLAASDKHRLATEVTCDHDLLSRPGLIDEVMQQNDLLVARQTASWHCARALLDCDLLVVAVHCLSDIQLHTKDMTTAQYPESKCKYR